MIEEEESPKPQLRVEQDGVDAFELDLATSPTTATLVRPSGSETGGDWLAREEPLEIRLGPVSLAVVMRTPGHDLELARGFLVSERIIQDLSQVVSLRHCTIAESPEAEDNVVQVQLREDVDVDLERLRRNLYASSSCGICGKATIENAMDSAPPLEERTRFEAGAIATLTAQLLRQQQVFAQTGGLHAAGIFHPAQPGEELLVVREDVGRHNAVDKVLGWASQTREFRLNESALVVSGRISFEIVQKALAARIPLIVAVSAPTSLAVDFAKTAGITLVGFSRGDSMKIYTHPQRLLDRCEG